MLRADTHSRHSRIRFWTIPSDELVAGVMTSVFRGMVMCLALMVRAMGLPEILESPEPIQKVKRGNSVTLEVKASGIALAYQWFRDGEMISAETQGMLHLVEVTESAVYHVTVRDETGEVSSLPAVVLVTIPGENSPPIFTELPGGNVRRYQTYHAAAEAADPDGDVLSFSIQGEVPDFLEIIPDENTLLFTGIPEKAEDLGLHEFKISVSDGNGGIGERLLILHVEPAQNLPLIESFSADPPLTVKGEPVVLKWVVDQADSIMVDQGVGDVTGRTFIELFPQTSTTYRLTARNENGPSQSETTVDVHLPPIVEAFAAEPVTLVPWSESRLSWSVFHAGEVRIEPSIGPVEHSGSMLVAPLDTTLYRLHAKNPHASVVATLQIEVDPAFSESGPLIRRRPVSHYVGAGETIVLSVEADGVAPLRFQWRKDGELLPMKTSSQLILEELASEDSGLYSVWVGDTVGVTASPVSRVTVVSEPLDPRPAFANVPPNEAIQQRDYVYETVAVVNSNRKLAAIDWIELPSWLKFESMEGGAIRLSGTPSRHDIGLHELVLEAVDADSGAVSILQTAVEVPPNSSPIASSFPETTVPEDHGQLAFDLFEVFTDPEDADAQLNYELTRISNQSLFQNIDIVRTASDARLLLTPSPNAYGVSVLAVRATDPGFLSAESTLTVNVTPVNDRPIATLLDPILADEAASDVVIETARYFSDVDNSDQLVYSVKEESNKKLFENVDIDPLTGILTLAFAPYVHGSSEIILRATDGGGLFAESQLDVRLPPIPAPDVIVEPPSQQRLGRKSFRLDQVVIVKNNSGRSVGGFKFGVASPPGVLIDGINRPDMIVRQVPLAPNEEVAYTLTFNSSEMVINWDPAFIVETIVPTFSPPSMPAEAFAVTQIQQLVNGSILMTFDSQRGALYGVQYFDGARWRDTLHGVLAMGRNSHWIDMGPPDTLSHPSRNPLRIYRVIRRQP